MILLFIYLLQAFGIDLLDLILSYIYKFDSIIYNEISLNILVVENRTCKIELSKLTSLYKDLENKATNYVINRFLMRVFYKGLQLIGLYIDFL